jgi:hypothetical protein
MPDQTDTPTTDPKANIAAAICHVLSAVAGVRETGRHQLGYSFASDADVLKAVRPAMVEAGLALVPAHVDYETNHNSHIDHKFQFRTDLKAQYLLMHVSGETQPVESVGCGLDPTGEKGPLKAMTGALKYACRQVFLLPTGDDPDFGHPEPQAHEEVDINAVRREAINDYVARANATKHPSYTGAEFHHRLKETELGYTVDDVRGFLLWLGKPKPSTMTPEGRAKVVAWLREDSTTTRFSEYLDVVNRHKTEEVADE